MFRNSILFLSLILLFFSPMAIADQLAEDFLRVIGSVRTDIYSEFYSSPLTETSNQFQRIRLLATEHVPWTPFMSLERFSSGGFSNVSGEAGVRNKFGDWQILAGFRREKLNEPSVAYWNARLGLIFSHFWQLEKSFYADSYAEVFGNQQEAQNAAVSVSGWAKVGYRYLQQNHYIFDPLIAGVRFYDNSQRKLLGNDYQLIQVGIQGGYYLDKPDLSSTLILTKSWARSQGGTVANSYWLLWALGVRF